MKKIFLFFIIVISIIGFWTTSVHAVECGSVDGANPTLMEVNSIATCTSPSDNFEGYYYYFYLDSRQEVHFTVTSQPENWRVSFAIAKKDEWSSKLLLAPNTNIKTGLWGDDGWVIDAGYWEILVIPNPTKQSDDTSGSFQGVNNFSLNITTKQQPTAPSVVTPSEYCGDGSCNGGEICSSCSNDCGVCSIPNISEPIVPSEYCGDNYCNGDENCSSCSSDCGVCDKETKNLELRTLSSVVIDKKGGATQDLSIFYPVEYWAEIAKNASSPQAIKSAEKEIVGLLKKFKLDVKSAKLKIDTDSRALRVNFIYSHYAFPPNSHLEIQGYDDFWILPTVTIGDKVEQGAFCKMDEHKMEAKGQKVMLEGKHTQTMESAMVSTVLQQRFNQAFTLPKEAVDIRIDEEACVIGYKFVKKKIGEKAASSSECQSGWLEKGRCIAPKVLSFSFPKEIILKKGMALSLPLAIQNVSQQEVALDDKVLVSQSPNVIDVESGLLKIYKQTLAPNEAISSDAEQSDNSIDKLNIKAKKSGRGKIILKFNYAVDGRLNVSEVEIIINVSKEHIRAHSEATKLFGQKMIWEEIKKINNKEYIFVKPEDNAQFEGAIYNWQQAHAAFISGIDDLMAEGMDIVQPDVVSFLVMVKGFNEAETPQQLTKKSFKTLIPASLQAGATFVNMMTPFVKQQKQEKFLMKNFSVKNLTYIPDYNENNFFQGYIVAITKEKNGRVYAIQLGRL